MLPGGGVRYRGGNLNVADGMNRLTSVMNDSARRYRRLPFMGKVIFILSLIFSFLAYTLILRYFIQHDITDDNFLGIPKCPACFGSSGCQLLYYNQVKLSGWSNYRILDAFRTKNIRYATLADGKKVVLKKMGTDQEMAELDRRVCHDARRPDDCDVARVLFLTDIAETLRREPVQAKHLKQSVGMFTCASYRLIDRLWNSYKERRKSPSIMLGDKLQVWFTAQLNAEPLFLQTFPAADRWPFPEYLGACGRQVIVEHVGRALSEVYNEPFPKRAGIAHELLKIADQLTHNDEDFALYITDPNWDNFAVDSSGKVRILDAENIIVVDKLAIDAKKPKGFDQFIESQHGQCKDNTCVSMVPEQLCTHLHSDHNYYAVCVTMLDPLISDGIMPGGLLHDMPEEARDFWDLENLLKECARPSKPKGRLFAKDKLTVALDKLRGESKEHLDHPPKPNPAVVRKFVKKKELWEYPDYPDEDEEGEGMGNGAQDEKEM